MKYYKLFIISTLLFILNITGCIINRSYNPIFEYSIHCFEILDKMEISKYKSRADLILIIQSNEYISPTISKTVNPVDYSQHKIGDEICFNMSRYRLTGESDNLDSYFSMLGFILLLMILFSLIFSITV